MEQVVRIKYSKDGPIKYISHLNLVQVFTRALRRASIPVLISSGFNPRLRISFGPPLALGISSTGEYFDIRLTKEINSKELIIKMNNALPVGLHVINAEGILPSSDSLVKSIDRSRYLVTLQADKKSGNICKRIESELKKFLELEEIWIEKSGKKGIKKVNIKPSILNLKIGRKIDDKSKCFILELNVKMGNNENINPIYIIKAWMSEYDYRFKIINLCRDGLFVRNKAIMPG